MYTCILTTINSEEVSALIPFLPIILTVMIQMTSDWIAHLVQKADAYPACNNPIPTSSGETLYLFRTGCLVKFPQIKHTIQGKSCHTHTEVTHKIQTT